MRNLYKVIPNLWQKSVQRFGLKRCRVVAFLLFIGILGALIQLLIFQKLNHTALLYIFVPYIVSIFVAWFRSYNQRKTIFQQYISQLSYSLIILFSTSVILREGFICVIFFIPIYLVIITVIFILVWLMNKYPKKNNTSYSLALPALFIALSLEGTSSVLTLPRDSYIEVNRVVPLTINQIKDNLIAPINLDTDRHWFISLFPMPYQVDSSSLNEGDVHKIYTRYHRWFITNTHEGMAELLIEEVGNNKIKTKILSDTTYFATYLSMSGSEISLNPITENTTEITLRINYQRKLDPAWYFHPLLKFGVTKMADLLIKEVFHA